MKRSIRGHVPAHRSGYSAAERRAIESALHTGVLCGVAATNALELGIDIGKLDVTLHLSFPGSVASMWQQAGRAGGLLNRTASMSNVVDLLKHLADCSKAVYQ